MDLYRVLAVRRNAGQKAIEHAYRKKAMETHPDRGGSADAFGAVRLAYEVLRDPGRRAAYDRDGTTDPPKPDESTQQALQVLSNCLALVIQEVVKQGGKMDQEDVIGHMKTVLANGLKDLKQRKAALEKTRAAADVAIGRFATDGDENVLADLARYHLSQAEQAVAGTDAEIAKVTRAGELLKKYRYKFDRPETLFAPGSWRAPTATSSTATGFFFRT